MTSCRRLNIPDGTQLTASDLFGAYVELGQTVTPQHLAIFSDLAHDDETKAQLEILVAQQQHFPLPDGKPPLLLDILEALPRLPMQTFLRMLPPMRPRTYSVSSALGGVATNKTSTNLSLTLSVVQRGVASTYLSTAKPGHVLYLRMQPNPLAGFRLPWDPSQPVVMICVDSGLAPFRRMIQQRLKMTMQEHKHNLGRCISSTAAGALGWTQCTRKSWRRPRPREWWSCVVRTADNDDSKRTQLRKSSGDTLRKYSHQLES